MNQPPLTGKSTKTAGQRLLGWMQKAVVFVLVTLLVDYAFHTVATWPHYVIRGLLFAVGMWLWTEYDRRKESA